MNHRTRVAVAAAGTVGLFLCIQLGALALIDPFRSAGFRPVEDPSDPTNSLVYVGAILVATAGMFVAFRFDLQWLIRGLVIVSSAFLSWYVLGVVLPPLVVVNGLHVLAAAGALGIGVGLAVHPEWYVIDAAGVVMGVGAAGLFGITFGILPAVVLLVVLAVYDAISVYGTQHMLSLADEVMEMKIPVLLVVPVSPSYSFLDGGDTTDDERRDAFFIGLGDAVIPSVMVTSAAFFGPAASLEIGGIALALPVLTAMIGTLAGLLVLLWMVLKGRAHAGLPLLNGGTIAGYLVGALASGLTLTQALGLASYL